MPELDLISDYYFTCVETPLWFPTEVKDVSSLKKCTSCTVRLTSHIPGPGKLTPSVDGFLVDENTQVFLSYNGLSHTLKETRLVMPGLHRLPGENAVGVAELVFIFQGDYENAVTYCLCAPINVGNGYGNEYFRSLGLNSTPKRPTIGTLFNHDVSYIQYTGAPIVGRTAKSLTPKPICEPVSQKIRYIVSLKKLFITSTDLGRLNRLNSKTFQGACKPAFAAPVSRINSIVNVIPEIIVESSPVKTTLSNEESGKIPTAAVKCRRIDVDKDIKDNILYVGGDAHQESTLAEELSNAADSSKIIGLEKSSIKPGKVQKVIGILIGLLIGVVLSATIAYYVLKYTFPNYESFLAKFPGFKVAKSFSLGIGGPFWLFSYIFCSTKEAPTAAKTASTATTTTATTTTASTTTAATTK
jgi:hypothetical protein